MNNDLQYFEGNVEGMVGCLVSVLGKVQNIFLILTSRWPRESPLRSDSILYFTSSGNICFKVHLLSVSNYNIISE